MDVSRAFVPLGVMTWTLVDAAVRETGEAPHDVGRLRRHMSERRVEPV